MKWLNFGQPITILLRLANVCMRAGVHNWMHDNNFILGDFDVASHRILNAETKLNGGIWGMSLRQTYLTG